MTRQRFVSREAALHRLASHMFRALKIPGRTTLDIILLPDHKMAALKARFIKNKKKTEPNVLAFPEPHAFPHPELGKRNRYIGEIYLNTDILGKSPERTAPLLLHGLLHLLGYDHKRNSDAKKMEALEKKILREIKPSPTR